MPRIYKCLLFISWSLWKKKLSHLIHILVIRHIWFNEASFPTVVLSSWFEVGSVIFVRFSISAKPFLILPLPVEPPKSPTWISSMEVFLQLFDLIVFFQLLHLLWQIVPVSPLGKILWIGKHISSQFHGPSNGTNFSHGTLNPIKSHDHNSQSDVLPTTVKKN